MTQMDFYILDYVQPGNMTGSLDVNAAIADPDNTGLWSMNSFQSGNSTPFGVLEQYLVSLGATFPSVDVDFGGGGSPGWSTAPVLGAGADTSPAAHTAFFQAFFSPTDMSAYNAGIITNVTLSTPAPFTPMRLVVQRMVYEANDPLVHYLTSDLNDFPDDTTNRVSLSSPTPTLEYIGRVNDHYMPWGTAGNLAKTSYYGIPLDNNPYNLAYKDPLARKIQIHGTSQPMKL